MRSKVINPYQVDNNLLGSPQQQQPKKKIRNEKQLYYFINNPMNDNRQSVFIYLLLFWFLSTQLKIHLNTS